MGKHWILLGEYNAETTTYSAFTGGAGASPYTPGQSGRLTGLRMMVAGGAATQLVNHVQAKLTCASFKPNSIEVGCQGCGLRTVPAFQQRESDWDVDQPIEAGVPIYLEGRNVTADTPVGVDVALYGRFETS